MPAFDGGWRMLALIFWPEKISLDNQQTVKGVKR
jgi:hypothetical protein